MMSIESLARSYTSLGRAIQRFPTAPWDDALSHGQLQSKAWAITELNKLSRDLGIVYVMGGWLGTMAMLMFESSLQFKKIRSFDIDPSCGPIADRLNIEHVMTEWRFKAVTMDIFTIDYDRHCYHIPLPGGYTSLQIDTCNTVINTCCDHIAKFTDWWSMIPKGKFVVLQNNDFENGHGHVNTVDHVDDMIIQAPMTEVLFKGTLKLEKYRRFMTIGIK